MKFIGHGTVFFLVFFIVTNAHAVSSVVFSKQSQDELAGEIIHGKAYGCSAKTSTHFSAQTADNLLILFIDIHSKRIVVKKGYGARDKKFSIRCENADMPAFLKENDRIILKEVVSVLATSGQDNKLNRMVVGLVSFLANWPAHRPLALQMDQEKMIIGDGRHSTSMTRQEFDSLALFSQAQTEVEVIFKGSYEEALEKYPNAIRLPLSTMVESAKSIKSLDKQAEPNLILESDVKDAQKGDLLTVTVTVKKIENLYGADFEVVYDPVFFRYIESEEGEFLKKWFHKTSFAVELKNGEEGRLVGRWGVVGNGRGLNGSGELATIKLEVIADGGGVTQVFLDKIALKYPGRKDIRIPEAEGVTFNIK